VREALRIARAGERAGARHRHLPALRLAGLGLAVTRLGLGLAVTRLGLGLAVAGLGLGLAVAGLGLGLAVTRLGLAVARLVGVVAGLTVTGLTVTRLPVAGLTVPWLGGRRILLLLAGKREEEAGGEARDDKGQGCFSHHFLVSAATRTLTEVEGQLIDVSGRIGRASR
jgi:hypothetical protein